MEQAATVFKAPTAADLIPYAETVIPIEPKSYMANERTFLEYLTMSGMLFLSGFGLLRHARAIPTGTSVASSIRDKIGHDVHPAKALVNSAADNAAN